MPVDGRQGRLEHSGQQRRVERISQAAVELRPSDAEACFAEVRGIMLDWLAEKAGGSLPDHIRQGATGELNTIGAQRVETAALDEPPYWTARQDDMDRQFARRTWVTEAALARHGNSRVMVGHRLHCVTMGDPAPFARSIPRFMRAIARRYDTYLDGIETGLTARRADSRDDADDLVRLLLDGNRRHPVIGVSCDPEFLGGPAWLVDPDQLANDLFGVAHVWSISPEAAYQLSDSLGRELSVFHGGIRSWRLPMTLEDTGYGHPLAIAKRISSWGDIGPAAFRRELTDWALRFSAGRRDADQLLPPFASVRSFAAGIARDRAAAEGASDRELLQLALDDNNRLEREMLDLHDTQIQLLTLLEEDTRRVQAERDNALQDAARLRARVNTLESALREQRKETATAIPDSLSALSDWAAQELDDRVQLLPRAVNGAKKSPFEDVDLVYQTLIALRDKYVPMRRSGGAELKTLCEATWRELGLELTPSFAGGGAGQFGDEYRTKWNGRNRQFDMHLKGSNSRDPRYGFRCYFFWDEQTQSVVVGAIPGHLATNAT